MRYKTVNFDAFLSGAWGPPATAARYLGRSRSWVIRLARAGKLPCAVTSSGRLLFSKGQLDKAIGTQQQEGGVK
jgi:predicted site-specific integrase-resolvase